MNLQNSSGFLVSVLLQMTFLSWGVVRCLLTVDVLLMIGVQSMKLFGSSGCVCGLVDFESHSMEYLPGLLLKGLHYQYL